MTEEELQAIIDAAVAEVTDEDIEQDVDNILDSLKDDPDYQSI